MQVRGLLDRCRRSVLGEPVLGGGPATDGFAITKTTSRLPAGPHTVALQCTESNPDLTIDNPTIAAVAVTTGNH